MAAVQQFLDSNKRQMDFAHRSFWAKDLLENYVPFVDVADAINLA